MHIFIVHVSLYLIQVTLQDFFMADQLTSQVCKISTQMPHLQKDKQDVRIVLK